MITAMDLKKECDEYFKKKAAEADAYWEKFLSDHEDELLSLARKGEKEWIFEIEDSPFITESFQDYLDSFKRIVKQKYKFQGAVTFLDSKQFSYEHLVGDASKQTIRVRLFWGIRINESSFLFLDFFRKSVYNINIEKRKEMIFMKGYSNDALREFIAEKMDCLYLSQFTYDGNIEQEYKDNFLGQGISRTVFGFDEYPDIVFKLCVGSNGIDGEVADAEEKVYCDAIQEGLSQFFLPEEYVGDITIIVDDDEDEDENGPTDVRVYVQPRIDVVWRDKKQTFLEKGAWRRDTFKKEKRILERKHWSEPSRELYSAILRKYGYDTYKNLSLFLFTRHIYDLHTGNWGYYNDEIVIMDYGM